MKFLCVLVLILSTVSYAQEDSCSELLGLSVDAEIERLELSEFIKQAKTVLRSQNYSESQIAVFSKLLSLTPAQIGGASTHNLLKIHSVFAHWNFLPPDTYVENLYHELKARLPQWNEKNFSYFAFSRKLTPLVLPAVFLKAYNNELLRRFEKFSVPTQMEVLGAELFHGSRWSSKETHRLLLTLAHNLSMAPEEIRIKPLKELYRGLLYLRAMEPSLFFNSIVRLEQAIESRLSVYQISLNEDGTSGAQNDDHKLSPARKSFELRLDEYLRFPKKIREYANPVTPGFYDPVDVFYPDQNLILEWDGHHHYFRTLWPDGRLNTEIPRVLRPMDQIKDASLKRHGYQVLRISPEFTDILPLLDLEELLGRDGHTYGTQ